MHNTYAQQLRAMARAADEAGQPYEDVDFLNDCAAHIEALASNGPCLDRPARVGSTIFGAGIHWGTVIHAAQMDYAQQPAGAPLAQEEGGAQ